jgi:hypothetical protein
MVLMAKVVRVVKLTNTRSTPIEVILEPWANAARMDPGVTFTIRAEALADGDLELTFDDDQIIIWGWVGSTMTVSAGEDVVTGGYPPVPDVPPGMSVRSFIHRIFG